jgi:hypothetical protein
VSARSDYRDRDIKDIYFGILSDNSLANDVLDSVGSGIIVHCQSIPAFEYWLPLLVRNKWRQHSFHFRWDSPITLGTILSQFLIKFSSLCRSIKWNKENQFGKNPMWVSFGSHSVIVGMEIPGERCTGQLAIISHEWISQMNVTFWKDELMVVRC